MSAGRAHISQGIVSRLAAPEGLAVAVNANLDRFLSLVEERRATIRARFSAAEFAEASNLLAGSPRLGLAEVRARLAGGTTILCEIVESFDDLDVLTLVDLIERLQVRTM